MSSEASILEDEKMNDKEMNEEEIHSIISLEDDIFPVTEEDFTDAENICDPDSLSNSLYDNEDLLDPTPQLKGDSYPPEFLGMIETFRSYIKVTPQLDFTAIYEELEELSVRSESTPTLQHINMQLQRVQASKERLSEIIMQIMPSHTIKKRSVDILKESWTKFSSEGSVDKRKADAVFRLGEFEQDYVATDAVFKTCMHISRNLDSFQDNLSRRITIMGLQLKLNDLNKTVMPDYEFGRGQDLEGTLVSSGLEEGEEVDPTVSIEPDERSF